ncbi:bifunctional sugar-1-phosphate nucleotidylyltransferase/acetyltransferase [Chloroflexota bacterium]
MKQAVILAAGEGQRLRPFTVNKPKSMLTIADKPILQYVISALAQNGIRNIVLVVGYKREQVFDYMGSGEQFGVDITYITQESQLGSAHALAQTRDATEKEFLVLSGDNLIGADTLTQFLAIKPPAVLTKRVENPDRYGVVTVAEGKVQEITEKPREPQSNVVSTGIYAFTQEIFDFIDDQLTIPEVLNSMIAQGHQIKAEATEGTWHDVVYPWDILRLNDALLRQVENEVSGTIETDVSLKRPVSIGKNSIVRSNSYIVGPVVIGENCDIGPNVCIMPSTSIGDNVVISPFTEVSNSVIANHINIGPSSIIRDSVIDSGCCIAGRFTATSDEVEVKVDHEHHLVHMGAILGEGCNLGSGVVAEPGAIVGNHCRVRSLKLLGGRLPDGSLVV